MPVFPCVRRYLFLIGKPAQRASRSKSWFWASALLGVQPVFCRFACARPEWQETGNYEVDIVFGSHKPAFHPVALGAASSCAKGL